MVVQEVSELLGALSQHKVVFTCKVGVGEKIVELHFVFFSMIASLYVSFCKHSGLYDAHEYQNINSIIFNR
jgi:hypothetical protein